MVPDEWKGHGVRSARGGGKVRATIRIGELSRELETVTSAGEAGWQGRQSSQWWEDC